MVNVTDAVFVINVCLGLTEGVDTAKCDVNGDGAISITDLVQINNHLLKKSTLTGAAASAADVNADGVISITDLVQVNNHLLKKSTITPN